MRVGTWRPQLTAGGLAKSVGEGIGYAVSIVGRMYARELGVEKRRPLLHGRAREGAVVTGWRRKEIGRDVTGSQPQAVQEVKQASSRGNR